MKRSGSTGYSAAELQAFPAPRLAKPLEVSNEPYTLGALPPDVYVLLDKNFVFVAYVSGLELRLAGFSEIVKQRRLADS